MRSLTHTLLIVISIIAFCLSAQATHNMGKDMQYTYIGTSAGQAQYRVTIHYYRNCWDNTGQSQAVPAPLNLTVEVNAPGCSTVNYVLPLDTTAVPSNGSEITSLCTSQISASGCNWTGAGNPPYPGTEIYTYSGIVTIAASCTQVTFGTSDCCRNGAVNNIANPGSNDLAIVATANNGIDPNTGQPYGNNSVVFNSLPVVMYCLGTNVTYSSGAVDADGDSLAYSLINPLAGTTMPYSAIPFAAGYTVNCPVRTLPANSFQFDTHTGQMQFTPGYQEQDVMAVRVDEYRNGVLIGSTMRDIQLVILNCAVSIPDIGSIVNIQNAYQTSVLSVNACPGSQCQFDIICTDPTNHNLTVNSNINSLPSAIPGASLTQVGTGDTLMARFSWTPTAADTGCHFFEVTLKNNDCPLNGIKNSTFSVCILNQVQVLSNASTFCGQPVQLSATGGTNFSWNPATGPNAVSNPASYSPTVSPLAPTTYYFSSDCGSDSVFINVSSPFQVNLGNDTVLCFSDSIRLHVSTANAVGNPTYAWSTIGGHLSGNTMANPLASNPATGAYYCVVTDTFGCAISDSIKVSQRSIAFVTALLSADSVCPGSPVTLYPHIGYTGMACGIATEPCSGNSFSGQAGQGSLVMPAGSATSYPTVYGNYRKSMRMQMLYKQADLTQALGAGGQISQIAFDIATLNSGASLQNFEIRIGCTQVTALTTWQTGTTLVYQRPGYSPVSGWNNHPLDFPYNWDGNSNLIIEICFYNPTTSGSLNNKVRSSTAGYQAVYYSSGSASQCGNTGTPSSSTLLPNIKIDICQAYIGHSNIVWSSISQPNQVNDSTNTTPAVNPVAPEVFYFRLYDSVCSRVLSDSVAVAMRYTYSTVNINLCQGESYEVAGVPRTVTGVYYDTLPGANGCRVYTTINLHVNPVATGSFSQTICPGSTYTFNGENLSAPGIYKDTLVSQAGCDSIATLNLLVNSVIVNPVIATICQGHTYLFNGQQLTTAGFYSDTLAAQGGCDSIVNLTLNVNPSPLVTLSGNPDTLCYGGMVVTLNGGDPAGGIYLVNGAPSNFLNPGLLGPGTHTVSYEYTDSGNCTNTATEPVEVVICTGIKYVEEIAGISINPNPVAGQLHFVATANLLEEVRIFSVDGKLLAIVTRPEGNSVDVSKFDAGIYIAEVKSDNRLLRLRWLKL